MPVQNSAPSRTFSLLFLLLLVLFASIVPVYGDPPADNPPGVVLPRVFCFRITDIASLGGNSFRFEFEVLNWTNQNAAGMLVARNIGTSGLNPFLPPAIGAAPFFAGGGVDADGRPLGFPGNDDGNFQPNDGTPGSKVGAINSWTVGNNMVGNPNTATAIRWNAGNPIPFRDLLAPPVTTAGACAMVPGCVVTGGLPFIANPETIDNGGGTPYGGVDNVLDGFTIDVNDFNVGELLSFNWFLLNAAGNPIGVVGPGPNNNQFGFGVFNVFRVASPGPPVWCRGSVAPGMCNTGTSRDVTYAYQNASLLSQFEFEFGAGITGAFSNSADNIFNAPVNGVLIIPEPSTAGLVFAGILFTAFLRRIPCRRC